MSNITLNLKSFSTISIKALTSVFNKMKMTLKFVNIFDKKSALLFLMAGIILTTLITPLIAESRRTFYSFEIILPEEVEAVPGEQITVDGKILVTGIYWLHNFNLEASGISYDYEITPEWWEHVRILRSWNSDIGVFREPDL